MSTNITPTDKSNQAPGPQWAQATDQAAFAREPRGQSIKDRNQKQAENDMIGKAINQGNIIAHTDNHTKKKANDDDRLIEDLVNINIGRMAAEEEAAHPNEQEDQAIDKPCNVETAELEAARGGQEEGKGRNLQEMKSVHEDDFTEY